jgi:hypothetical protein
MTFSILHTSARPEQWKKVYDAWIAAADRPEDVEYILCADIRWGFSEDHVVFRQGQHDALVWNTKRRCYVDGVNIAAARSTGNVLIVNADDQYPCEHWDTIIANALNHSTAYSAVIWANTNTPRERDRKIMPMPILTRAYYEQKGYVFYPKYESMYSDNDFCEQALLEQDREQCKVIALNVKYVFPHRHPYFDPTATDDDIYKAQNRQEAYSLGIAVLTARRANRYTEIGDTAAVSKRKRIAICVSGETFSASWLAAWTELMQLSKFHDLIVTFANSSNVHVTRIQLAMEVLKITPAADYILWIDDDNLVTPQNVLQLLTDLEYIPRAAMVAGWTVVGGPVLHSAQRTLSCGRIKPDGTSVPLDESALLSGLEDLKEIDYTGFPVILMRRDFLYEIGPKAFAPILNPHHKYGFVGEDVSFCTRARDNGYHIYVDRRVAVPHLKLRDILSIVNSPADAALENTHDLPRLNQRDAAAERDHSRFNAASLTNAAV